MRQKKKEPFKFRQEATKHDEDERKPQQRRRVDIKCTDRCHKCGNSHHRKASDVQHQSTNVKFVGRLVTSVACATRRKIKAITIKGP